jgi:hypothetical protein
MWREKEKVDGKGLSGKTPSARDAPEREGARMGEEDRGK